ncbi:MAG: Hsp20 family protein, partial [Solobacterium sp.]|nr:Hsp20 family protein [Solobacterium sp.]
YKKEDIKMEIANGNLTIKAKHELNDEEKYSKGNIVRSERSFGSCSRSFYVGSNIKASDIKARFENGILVITLPSEKQKQIESKEMISID